MKRLWQRIKEEPALIGAGVTVALTVGAAFGLDITAAQQDALLMLAGFIGAVGFGVRSQVKPTAKIKREEGKLKPLYPDLGSRRGRGKP